MALSVGDQLAINQLVALHGHLFDEGDFASLEHLFAADVIYDLSSLGGPILDGIPAIVDASLRLGDDNPIAHHVTNVVVAEDDDGTVRVVSKGLAVRPNGSVGSVVYHDVVKRTPAGWRIARRAVTLRTKPLAAG